MRARWAIAAMFVLFISVQVVALALVPLYAFVGYQAFPNPNNVLDPIYYVFILLAMTGFILLMIRLGLGKVIRAVIIGAIGVSTAVVSLPIIYEVIPDANVSFILSIVAGAVLVAALVFKPEWYVINIAGFIVGVGAAIILGISLGILPVFVLLVILAIYDAISVYKTKHMVTLAEGVVPLRLPVMFVVPKKKEFKMESLQAKPITEAEPEEREAMFMGVGDAVIPTILTVSSYAFLDPARAVVPHGDILVALGTLIGSCIGFGILMRYVLKGNPQAGLPLLNGGALAGYIITYLLVFQNLSFGFT